MDIKPWEYADFPAFNEPVPGATRVPTTGDEIGVTYHPDVPYATAGTTTPDVYLEVQHPCWSCNSNSSSANASAGPMSI